MKSSEAFKQVLCPVGTKFGSPYGRRNVGEKPTDKRIFCRRIRLDSGAYDKGGAYWGFGNPLFVEYTADLTYIRFFRRPQ